jgi:hypothetical protein
MQSDRFSGFISYGPTVSRPPLRKIMPISCTQLASAGVIINKLTISCPYCKLFFSGSEYNGHPDQRSVAASIDGHIA